MSRIDLKYYTGSAVELTAAEASLYGTMDPVRQAVNAAIRRWVAQWRELLRGKVLDFGCGRPGTCRIPQPFRELIGASAYVGVDVGEPRPPGNSQVFDAILCTQVLQDIERPVGIFEDFHGWLKPGGYLVMTYPIAWQQIEQELWRFTEKGIWLLCHTAGLQVVQNEALVRADLDGAPQLDLVGGLVARRKP